MAIFKRQLFGCAVIIGLLFLLAGSSLAQERLCDTSFEDCRQPLWNLIDAETTGIDVSLWFIQDTSYANKLIARFNAGVPVRILVDPRANPTYAGNEAILNQLAAAHIPMRYKVADCILHRKFMLFAGQGQVEFSGANYGPAFFVPTTPYQNYIDEAIYFTSDPAVVNSFKTIIDDMWTDTVNYGNYANITGPLTRRYPTFAIDPELNFPPSADGTEDFYNRTEFNFNHETQKIDVIMYRITNDRYTNITAAAVQRGIPVRLITEQNEYRNAARQWDAYNVDLMYNAGVQIRIRLHQGLNHEKVAILYGLGMTIFGSSNWTGPSSNCQAENNYFTTKPWFFQSMVTQFERKWNSTTETQPFTPLPPDAPVYQTPANQATGLTTNVTLSWEGGPWAHKFDIYFGTNPTPPLLAADQFIGRVDNGATPETYQLPALQPGTTYFWRIVSKTMANMTATGPTWSFTTAGAPGQPPTVSSISPPSGSTTGGTQVTITGTNFVSGATVSMGGNAASNVSVTSSTSITAFAPAHAAGSVSISVTNPDGQSASLANAFTYSAPPPSGDIVLYASEAPTRVGNWSPVADSTAAGGARISNPDAGAAKLADPLAAPANYFDMSFTAQAGTAYRLWMRGKAQADNPFNDSVFVQFSDSVDSTGAAVFRIGTTSGTPYNLEDCSGCGLSGWGWQDNGWGVGVMGPLIYFASSGTHTIRIQVREDGLSIDQILLSPSTYLNQAPGALKNDVVILPKSGGSTGGSPAVSSVTPNSGSTAGGTSITITGTNFSAGASVSLGGASATNVNVSSSTSITATTPAHAAGAVNVTVTNSGGAAGTLTNGFTYTQSNPAPTVSSVSPSTGSAAGGTAVTITGTGFLAGATARFGGVSATNVSVSSSTTITATTPAHASGAVTVSVTNSDGQSGSLTNGFTYGSASNPAPTVTGVSPAAGSTNGGTVVSISGTNFLSGATVKFGGVAATNVSVNSATTITATTPAHAAGSVNVDVTNSDGQTGTLATGFTYSPSGTLETVLLADDFNDNSLNAANWNSTNLFSGFTDTALPIAETSQHLEIGPLPTNASGSHYAGIRSVSAFDFTNAYCYVEVVQTTAAATAADTMLTVGRDVNGYYRMYVESGSLIVQKRINGAKVNLTSLAYSTVSHRYWRIRHESATGNVVFETAPDNGGVPGTWTVRFTEAWNVAAIPLGSILFELKGGTWQPEATAPGKVVFDNFRAAKP